MITLDFDDIHAWGPMLSDHVSSLVSLAFASNVISTGRPEYLEDAAKIFFSDVFRDETRFTGEVVAWIEAQTVAAYHGSRLGTAEIDALKREGLTALSAERRREPLRKKLSIDPRWCETKFDAAFTELVRGQSWGKREGQVHATISRGGLVNGFNHYLTYGSEFDQCLVSLLFGSASKELLAQYGVPTLVQLAIPGNKALAAANPYTLNANECPNLVREIVEAWTYWLADSTLAVANLEYDCGLVFDHDVPPEWIVSIDNQTVLGASRRKGSNDRPDDPLDH
ncbi:MAG TPA: hypothetical protein VFB43_10870 [Terracidiphilus sp.]|nr:hypothetical protein [Terracidiphilus sp.]